jgi:hypothetical protein
MKIDSSRLDKVGMAVSTLCIVHCLAAPVMLFFLPAVATALISEEAVVHQTLYGLILVVALFSFIPGYRLHKKLKPLLLFGGGVVGLAFATFLAHDIAHVLEPIVAIPSSALIVAAHYYNHKSCKHACGEHTHINHSCDTHG